MTDTGEPWLQTVTKPEPGSSLAGDEKKFPGMNEIIRSGLVMAIDHLGSVTDALTTRRIRHYAHFTALRTTLLISARIIWLLDPRSREDRCQRALAIRYTNLKEMRSALADSGGAHLDAAVREGVKELRESLTGQMEALSDGGPKPQITDTVAQLKQQVDINTYDGSAIVNLWRTGSATAHGYYWNQLYLPDPGEFNEAWFNTTLYGAHLHLMRALDLYETRRSKHF